MRDVIGREGGPLRVALGLDGLALAALLVAVVLIENEEGPEQGTAVSIFAGLAFAAAIAAGGLTVLALVRDPLRSGAGRRALGVVACITASFPLLGLATAVFDLDEGWAEPVLPFQLAAALGAVVLGARADEPQRRGLLLIPLVIGAGALMFVVTDLLFPY